MYFNFGNRALWLYEVQQGNWPGMNSRQGSKALLYNTFFYFKSVTNQGSKWLKDLNQGNKKPVVILRSIIIEFAIWLHNSHVTVLEFEGNHFKYYHWQCWDKRL